MNAKEIAKLLKDKLPFSNPVPMVLSDTTVHAYLTNDIGEPAYYAQLTHVLNHIEDDLGIVLHINTAGGHLDSALQIIGAIKKCNAPVKAHLTGTVASAGTIIGLACDYLEVDDHTSFMIHNYSSGISGKGNEMMEYMAYSDKELRKVFHEVYEGFLTTKEINSVIKGSDKWMGADEVRKRWGKVIEKRMEKLND